VSAWLGFSMGMSIRILMVAVLTVGSSSTQQTTLEGCSDLSKLTTATAQLVNSWWEVTSDSLSDRWPDEIRALETAGSGGSGLFGTRSRVIKSECQCCEVFHFQSMKLKRRGTAVRLASMSVAYSTRSRTDTLDAGRELLSAFLYGASNPRLLSDVGDIGNRRVEWEDPVEGVLIWIETQTTRSTSAWTVRVSMTVAPTN
jgi:hypothetical protein